jgi:uncharacterized protein
VGLRRVFVTPGGRVRLVWRLLLFTVLFLVLLVGLTPLLPNTLVGSGAALFAAAVLPGWALLRMEGRPAAALGFPVRRETAGETLKGFGVGVIVASAAVLAILAAGGVSWSTEPTTAAAFVGAALGSAALLFLPAAAEEALVRGYPLQALSESWGAAPALLATSVLFGLLHAGNPDVGTVGLIDTGLAGVFIGVLYLRTGSLWWASGAHMGWNWAHGFLADLPVSGLEVADAPGIAAHVRGPALLSGGAFGPEGSLLTAGVLLVAVAWAWSTDRLRPTTAAREAPPLGPLREFGMGRARDAGRAPGSNADANE